MIYSSNLSCGKLVCNLYRVLFFGYTGSISNEEILHKAGYITSSSTQSW